MTQREETREVVGIFRDGEHLEMAVDRLEATGFLREQISVMASHDSVAAQLNNHFEPIEQMEDDPRIPQAAFISKGDRASGKAAVLGLPLYIGATAAGLAVVASGGALALAVAAAAAGGLAGAGLGGLAAHAIDEHHAKALDEHIASGGLLLWARIDDPSREPAAIEAMTTAGGEHVHAHDIARTWGEDDVPLHDFNPDPFLERD